MIKPGLQQMIEAWFLVGFHIVHIMHMIYSRGAVADYVCKRQFAI